MYNKRPYEGSGGGGRGGYGGGGGRGGYGGAGGRGGGRFPANNAPQKTEERVITNRWKLSPCSTDNNSDYMQYRVIIKNGWWKRVKDEATGDEMPRIFESREIAKKDMEKIAKSAALWKIMKKLVHENNFELAYDGNQKAYSTCANNGPVDGREYQVKVKRDCEDDDTDAERFVFISVILLAPTANCVLLIKSFFFSLCTPTASTCYRWCNPPQEQAVPEGQERR